MTKDEAVNIVRSILLTRKGESITDDLAIERARNVVTALDIDSANRLARETFEALRLAAAALEDDVDPEFQKAVHKAIMAVLAKIKEE